MGVSGSEHSYLALFTKPNGSFYDRRPAWTASTQIRIKESLGQDCPWFIKGISDGTEGQVVAFLSKPSDVFSWVGCTWGSLSCAVMLWFSGTNWMTLGCTVAIPFGREFHVYYLTSCRLFAPSSSVRHNLAFFLSTALLFDVMGECHWMAALLVMQQLETDVES